MSVQMMMDQHLQALEAKHNLRVLFACEAGSRAWGFASPDSDYDLRFVYVKPLSFYLSVFEQRDVVELQVEDQKLDASGWDLRKALALMVKSNPSLLEWLFSPLPYTRLDEYTQTLRTLAADFYQPEPCIYHYMHMARGNFKEYLQGEEVWVKKYLYVLRPVLAVDWLLDGRGIVPVQFSTLVDAMVTDSALRQAVDELVAEKQAGLELRRGPRRPVLDAFLQERLADFATLKLPAVERQDKPRMDTAFYHMVKRAQNELF